MSWAGFGKLVDLFEGAQAGQPGVRLEVPGEKHTENWFEVRGDLPRGADVVTTGHSQLAEGTPVRVREQP